MNFMQICGALKAGQQVTVGPNGDIHNKTLISQFTGRIIGIRPESGSKNISNWLLSFVVDVPGNTGCGYGEKIEIYWNEAA